MLEQLIVNKDQDSILKKLKTYGICIVRNYLDQDQIDYAKDEFFRIFKETDKSIENVHKHPTNKDGMVARVIREYINESKYPTIKEIFSSKFMNDVTKRYYSPYDFVLNEHIFCTHELPCDEPILPWHYDRQQSLKYFIYLKDTTVNDGAFEFAPGTHREGHFRANYYAAIGRNERDLPNDIPEDEIINPTSIEGFAGDLIIFDPDGFHRGGVVGEGGERLVLRGHSHPIRKSASLTNKVKRQLVQTPLNIASNFSGDFSRILGDEIKSGERERVKYEKELKAKRS